MIRLIPYRQGFQYDEYYKVHEKDLPTKFFQEERDSFIIEDHQDPVGIASHFMMKSVAYLSIWMDPDKKLAEKKKALAFITERIIKKNHPSRIIARGNVPYMIPVFEANYYYAKGKDFQKIIEKWRYDIDDSIFDDEGFIINQGRMEKIPFGWFNTKDKGCGWISAYNLLKINGIEIPMRECAEGLQRWALLGEVAGQDITTEWLWLRKKGLPAQMSVIPSNTLALKRMKESDSGILLYMHGRGAHYVTYRNLYNGTFQFYNAVYGKKNHIMKAEDFLKKYSLFPFSSVIYVKKKK